MANIRKILIVGIITGIIFIILDMLVAIATMPVLSSFADLPIWKTPPDIMAGIVFDLINGLILVGVYSVLYNAIPGEGIKKGLNYGIIVGLFRVVMMSFSVIVMYNVPLILVFTNLITGFVEVVILCMILAVIYEKLKGE